MVLVNNGNTIIEEVAQWLVLSSNFHKHRLKSSSLLCFYMSVWCKIVSLMQKATKQEFPNISIVSFLVHQFGDHLFYPNLTEAVSVDLTKENCNKMFAFDSFPVWEFPYSLFDIRYCAYCMLCAQFANLRTEPVPTQKKNKYICNGPRTGSCLRKNKTEVAIERAA